MTITPELVLRVVALLFVLFLVADALMQWLEALDHEQPLVAALWFCAAATLAIAACFLLLG